MNRDIEAWRAFLGPKKLDYYLPRFERIANGGSARWHWPALFLTWYWLLYRKMYVYALLYMVAPYVLSLPIGLAIGMLGGSEATTQMTVGVLTLIFILAPPFIANQLYFRHAQKHIKQLATTIKSREAYLAALSAKGGTSSVAVAFISVAVLVAVLGILAAVAIPAYSEYMRRAENAQATVYGKKVALEVLERYSATHIVETSPSVRKSLGPGQIPAAVRRVEIGAQDGAVTVVTKNGGTLVMTPYSNGKVGCSSPDIAVKHITESDFIGSVTAWAGHLEKNEKLAAQARNNSVEQFEMGDFKDTFTDIVIEAQDAHNQIAEQLLKDERIFGVMQKMVAKMVWQKFQQGPAAAA